MNDVLLFALFYVVCRIALGLPIGLDTNGIMALSGTCNVPPDVVLLNIAVLSGTWERRPAAGVTRLFERKLLSHTSDMKPPFLT